MSQCIKCCQVPQYQKELSKSLQLYKMHILPTNSTSIGKTFNRINKIHLLQTKSWS